MPIVPQDPRPLLSDPILDELYSIRRIMVSMHRAHSTQGDPWKLAYYASKTRALDHAIQAYIDVAKVPTEHQEQPPAWAIDMLSEAMAKATTAGDDAPPSVRIPGGE